MNQRRLIFLIYYATTATLIAMYMGQTNWLTYYRLTKEGVIADAIVKQPRCNDNSTFSYTFTLNGQSMEGSGKGGNGNPPCNELKSGDHVQISYLASAPRTNLPGNPQALLGNETAGIAVVALLIPPLLIFILFLFTRKMDVVKVRQ